MTYGRSSCRSRRRLRKSSSSRCGLFARRSIRCARCSSSAAANAASILLVPSSGERSGKSTRRSCSRVDDGPLCESSMWRSVIVITGLWNRPSAGTRLDARSDLEWVRARLANDQSWLCDPRGLKATVTAPAMGTSPPASDSRCAPAQGRFGQPRAPRLLTPKWQASTPTPFLQSPISQSAGSAADAGCPGAWSDGEPSSSTTVLTTLSGSGVRRVGSGSSSRAPSSRFALLTWQRVGVTTSQPSARLRARVSRAQT